MKKLAVLALLLSAVGLAQLSETTPLSSFENLRRLDNIDSSAPAVVRTTRSAFQAVNENALGYLPVMPVLHAEDAIAGVALQIGGLEATGASTLARVDGWLPMVSPLGFIGAIALQ